MTLPEDRASWELAGQRVGPYEMVALLDRERRAHAEYQAHHLVSGAAAEVRVVTSSYLNAEVGLRFRTWFQERLPIIAKLDHRHIRPILDYGLDGRSVYFAMPPLEARTLRDELAGSPAPDRIVPVFCALLDALDYAHQRGVTHDCLCPDKVLLGNDSVLLDAFNLEALELARQFDVARIFEGRESPLHFSGSDYLGYTNEPGPISFPCLGDPAVDLYAIGQMLFEVLAGQLLPRDSLLRIWAKRMPGAPLSLSREPLGVPPAWQPFIRRSLARDPQQRYRTATAMAEALQEAWAERQRAVTD
jgi:serine/threonine protein kinase